MMWIKQVFLGFIGLASGSAIAAGVFSFIISIGVVPRIIGKSRTAKDIVAYENAVILGGAVGNFFPVSCFGASGNRGCHSIWAVGRNIYRMPGCGSGGNSQHISHYVPAVGH